ncbi:Tautomerase [Penicillium lagena]|uniref:Tautomerase n=1 Tax=Penicillium lagena TaxID=94218 RepID=UPI002540AE86|nr:Tautomerase [Penicillium lagena]KAJ5626365.1 Tautomerase [Penicillium lagena]
MDLSKHRKPSLPRLTTNLTSTRRSRSTASLPVLVSKPLQNINVEKPAFQPTLFPENNEDDENAPPTVHYAPADALRDPEVCGGRAWFPAENCLLRGRVHHARLAQFSQRAGWPGFGGRCRAENQLESTCCWSHSDRSVNPQTQAADDSSKDGATKLVEDLALHLAQVYQRPESSMMITIQQDVCLLFGSASVPAYLLKIYALPYLIAPITNLRNTALIQNALLELLGAAPDQGVIIYLPIQEDNLATNGVTAHGEITRLQRLSQNESPGLFRTLSRSMSRRLKSGSGHNQSTLIIPAVQSPVSPPVPEILPEPISAAEGEKLIASPKDQHSLRGRKRDSFRDEVFNRLRFHDYLASQVKEKAAELEGEN